jgi:hypothetical protein
MNRKFQYCPDVNREGGYSYTFQELEALLKFKCLHQIDFETPTDRQDVQERGLDQWKNNGVRTQSQELGIRFYNEIGSSYLPSVSVRWINDTLGYGLFAEENLNVGNYVGEYTGIVRKYDRRNSNDYSYEYPILDDEGRGFVIDATSGYLTRFINHSFKPNLKPVYAFYDGFYHLIFLAISPIEIGTQLSYNYGYTYWYMRGQPEDL